MSNIIEMLYSLVFYVKRSDLLYQRISFKSKAQKITCGATFSEVVYRLFNSVDVDGIGAAR